MTPVEFYGAYSGYRKKTIESYNVQYYLMQQGAIWSAWSTKQANGIKRQRSPWEKQSKRKEPIKAEVAMKILDVIAR